MKKANSLYSKLTFPKISGRPFFYTNFVQTVDGKTAVLKGGKKYWPIGSQVDWQTLLNLRAFADCLIHGKKTAAVYPALDRLSDLSFQKQRQALGKNPNLPYFIITSHPNRSIYQVIKGNFANEPFLVTTKGAKIPKAILNKVNLIRMGDKQVNLRQLSQFLHQNNYHNVLVEGGAILLGQFIKLKLMDQIFLTIAPKLFGNEQNLTHNLVEGVLFPPSKVKKLKLLSLSSVDDEVYLRYQIQN